LVLMKMRAKEIPPSTFVAWQAVIGVPVLLLAAYLVEGVAVTWSWVMVLALAYTGMLSKGGSLFLQLAVVRRGSSVQASTTAFLLPVTGTIFGVAILGESVSSTQIGGATVILVGVALVIRAKVRMPFLP